MYSGLDVWGSGACIWVLMFRGSGFRVRSLWVRALKLKVSGLVPSHAFSAPLTHGAPLWSSSLKDSVAKLRKPLPPEPCCSHKDPGEGV